LVVASRAICALMELTRPVSRAYSSRASVNWAPEALGKFAVVKSPAARSNCVLKPRSIAGTICCALSQPLLRR
jgi:hypothetical protein